MASANENLQRVTDIFGIGTFTNFQRKLGAACQRLGATQGFRVAAALDFKRGANGQLSGFGRDGVIDLSPPLRKIAASSGGMTDDRLIERFRLYWEALLEDLTQAWVQAHENPLLVDPQVLFLCGLTTGQYLIFEKLQDLMAQRKPFHPSILTVVSDQSDKRRKSLLGYGRLKRLKSRGKLDVPYIFDNLGPLALAYSLQTLDQFVTTGFASVFRAPTFGLRSVAFAEMSRTLGEYGLFAGMRFASHRLRPWSESFSWRGLRSLLGALVPLPERGLAPSIDTLVTEAVLATREALREPSAQAIEATMDLERPFYVVCTVPLSSWPSERPIWVEFTSRFSHWLMRELPSAIPMFAPGNGTATRLGDRSAWLQVSVFFPIVGEPKVIRELRARERAREAVEE